MAPAVRFGPRIPPAEKPKPAYKNADRATYLRDPITGEKYYQCPLCPKRLRGHLTIHLRTHNGGKPWKCSQCSKAFSQKCNLQTHVKSVHDAEKRFNCELCPKTFDYKKNLERHMSGHLLEKPYKCPHCPRRFSSVDWLCKHKRVHTGEKPYSCLFCPEVSFAQYPQMMNHLRRHLGERPYFCKFCDLSFSSSGNLSTHTRTVHLKTLKEKVDPATCLFCEKVFLNSSRLFGHLRRAHIGEGARSYARSQYSSVFYKKKKKSSYRYDCEAPDCDKAYKTARSLRRHWLSHHTPESERPFSCVFCEKRFAENCFLRDHLVMHTREKPEECSICLESFHWKSALTKHVKSVHKKASSLSAIKFN